MEPLRSLRELLSRYAAGRRDFADAELEGEAERGQRGVQPAEVDLSRARIVADFRGADLRGARFVDANLKTCDFRGADLRGADLRGADFRGAALCSTDFAGARLDGARIAGATFHAHVFQEGDAFPGSTSKPSACGGSDP